MCSAISVAEIVLNVLDYLMYRRVRFKSNIHIFQNVRYIFIKTDISNIVIVYAVDPDNGIG